VSGGGWGTLAILGVLAFGLYQCSKEPEVPDRADFYSTPLASSAGAEDRADEAAESAVAGTTYADQGRSYGCTDDCSGHEAGYGWADANGITDPDECGGNSQSFEEGCRSYAEAYQEARSVALSDEGAE
jgi:hypothetical protein